MTNKIIDGIRLPKIETNYYAEALLYTSVLLCSLLWCSAALCLTMAEHIPAPLTNVLEQYLTTRKYSLFLGASVAIDGVIGVLAYRAIFEKRNFLLTTAGAYITILSVFLFLGFHFFFFDDYGDFSQGDRVSLISWYQILILSLPIIVVRYSIYQPMKN